MGYGAAPSVFALGSTQFSSGGSGGGGGGGGGGGREVARLHPRLQPLIAQVCVFVCAGPDRVQVQVCGGWVGPAGPGPPVGPGARVGWPLRSEPARLRALCAAAPCIGGGGGAT